MVSGVPQGSVLGPLLLILYNADMLNDLENKNILYADDTTLYAEVASPSERTNVDNFLNRDFNHRGIKINLRITHSITISRSRTPYPLHPQ